MTTQAVGVLNRVRMLLGDGLDFEAAWKRAIESASSEANMEAYLELRTQTFCVDPAEVWATHRGDEFARKTIINAIDRVLKAPTYCDDFYSSF